MTILTDPQVVGYNVQEICNQLGENSKVNATLNCIHQHAADSGTNTTVSETAMAFMKYANTVSRLMVVPSGSVTANASNYATITVFKRDGAGGSTSTVATLTTETGSWSPFVPVSMGTITGGALAAGSVLSYSVTKTGTGVQLPAFKMFLEIA